jgi:protocatechuate 3,4-dioxygenase beta subunit
MFRSSSGVIVALALGALSLGCLVNQPPEVTVGPRPNPLTVAPGGEVLLELEVTDPDGDEMQYEWVQIPAEPAGQFSDTHARNPTWIAPQVSETSTFNITVTVTDNEGGGVLGTTPPVLVRVQ